MQATGSLNLKSTSEYKNIPLEVVLQSLEAATDGLLDSEAGNRLREFGYNEIPETKKNTFLEFLLRYWGPMPWLVELAMGLSLILGHYLEGIIIFALLTLNAVIGHKHSSTSQKTVELLKKKLAVRAKVLREGKWATKEAREIVPGDIKAVKLGDIIPADAVIVDGELSVDQSALTGESLPAGVHKSDIIYSGSVVRQGEARCAVVNTGANTFFGKTAELVRTAQPNSHQEEVMMAIVKYMMYLGLAASVVVSLYALMMQIGVLMILTFIGMNYFHLEWDRLRTLVMLNLIFNSQFRVLIVRERRHFWSSLPGRELLILSTATIIGFALLGIYGVLVPSLTLNQVLTVLIFSALFTLSIDFPKYYLFRKFGL